MLGFRKPKDDTLICTKFARGEFSDDGHTFLVLKCVKEHKDPEKARYKIYRYGTVLDEKTDAFEIKNFGMEVPATTIDKAKDYMALWEDRQIRRGTKMYENIGFQNLVHFDNMDQNDVKPTTHDTRIQNLQSISQEINSSAPWTFKETSGVTGGPNLRATMSSRHAAYELQAQVAGHGIEAHVGRKGDDYILIVPEQEFEKLDKMGASARGGQKRKPQGQHM